MERNVVEKLIIKPKENEKTKEKVDIPVS